MSLKGFADAEGSARARAPHRVAQSHFGPSRSAAGGSLAGATGLDLRRGHGGQLGEVFAG
jgi:hypothetical protein